MQSIITNTTEVTNTGNPRLDEEAVIKAFASGIDVKESSRKTYGDAVRQYLHWLKANGKSLDQTKEEDIILYKQYLLNTGHKILTTRAYIIALHRFYAWAEAKKLYPNIAANIKTPRANQGGTKDHFIKMHLTDEQGRALLEQYDNPRDKAIVNLMLRTGLRTIEVSRARICDVTYRNGRRILYVWGKGMDAPDGSVFVVLTDLAWEPIQSYLQTRKNALQGEPLFVTEGKGSHPSKTGEGDRREHNGGPMTPRLIQLIVKRGLRAIGLDSHAYSAHSLRHTTATQIIKHGGTILDVKRALRHSSINTSMIYTASIEEEERLQKAPEDLLDNSF